MSWTIRTSRDSWRAIPSQEAMSSDPKRRRVYVVVSRQPLIASKFSTVICAPVYSRHDGLSTQVVGPDEGLKGASSIHCDELVSLPKSLLTHYVGRLGEIRMTELNRSLLIALDLE
jgi:mRNA interferase MazF